MFIEQKNSLDSKELFWGAQELFVVLKNLRGGGEGELKDREECFGELKNLFGMLRNFSGVVNDFLGS